MGKYVLRYNLLNDVLIIQGNTINSKKRQDELIKKSIELMKIYKRIYDKKELTLERVNTKKYQITLTKSDENNVLIEYRKR